MRRGLNLDRVSWAGLAAVVFLIGAAAGCGPGDRAESTFDDIENNPTPIHRFARSITIDGLKKHVYTLAADEMEGRHTGAAGGRAAAAYAAGRFEKLGLTSLSPGEDYRQRFPMIKKKLVESSLISPGKRLVAWADFMELFSEFEGERDVDLVFVGFGMKEDLDNQAVEGRLAAFYQGTPHSKEYDENLERIKIAECLERGAAGAVIIVDDEEILRQRMGQLKPYLDVERYYQRKEAEELRAEERRIVLGDTSAAALFGLDRDEFLALLHQRGRGEAEADILRTRVRMKTAFRRGESLDAANIFAVLEGTDKKEECVVLSAHYDHLGVENGLIFNGAYDNAAGVASVIETAAAFAAAAAEGVRPRRSIVFYLPDAEELGGVGSMHFLDDPPFPLTGISAAVNIDGIGREDEAHPRFRDFVHFYMSRRGREELEEIRDRSASVSRELRLRHRESYGGSDHIFFERAGIPVIALSTGHPEDHHKPTDTADKLDFRNIRDIARLAFACVWRIADAEDPIPRNSLR